MWIEIRLLIQPTLVIVVTPRAGVWIEIAGMLTSMFKSAVTPRAGVWIEIIMLHAMYFE